jgi:hypothetical protein
MAGDPSYPWDVKLAITGGSTYGFMLVSPEGKSKQIDFTEADGPEADRMNTKDISTTRDFSPRTDTPFSMGNFTGGVGQLEYDFNDESAYWWSSGIVTHVNGRVYPAPPASTLALTGTNGAITCIRTWMDANDVRYDFLVEGVNIWRRPTTDKTTGWTKVYVAGAAITDFRIMDSIGFIMVPSLAGTTDFLYQSTLTAAATWTPTAVNHTPFSDALGKPKYMHVIRGTCYAAVDNSKVFYTTDPTIDGWSGPIDTSLTGNISGPPGDDSYKFVGTNAVSDFFFCRKKDAIYSIDSQQDVLEVIWQWKDKPSQYNFAYACTGGDQFIYNVGPEVYVYDPQTGGNTPAGLARKSGFAVKEVLGLDADNQYMYVLARVRVPIIRGADSIALLRGVRQRGFWSFEVLWEDTALANKSYSYLAAVPFGVGTRLYWGQDNATDTVTYVMDIPAEWDETQSGSFATTASLWTSINRSGFPGFNKRHLYFNLNGLNLDPTNYINVYYSIDLGVTPELLTAAQANQTEANFVNEHGLTIMFRFDFVSTGTTPAILSNFDHHQRVRFKYLPAAKIAVRIAPRIETRAKSISNRTVAELWNDIVTLRTSNADIAYTDFLGNSYNVTVDLIGVHPTRHQHPTEYEEEAVLLITRADRGA